MIGESSPHEPTIYERLIALENAQKDTARMINAIITDFKTWKTDNAKAYKGLCDCNQSLEEQIKGIKNQPVTFAVTDLADALAAKMQPQQQQLPQQQPAAGEVAAPEMEEQQQPEGDKGVYVTYYSNAAACAEINSRLGFKYLKTAGDTVVLTDILAEMGVLHVVKTGSRIRDYVVEDITNHWYIVTKRSGAEISRLIVSKSASNFRLRVIDSNAYAGNIKVSVKKGSNVFISIEGLNKVLEQCRKRILSGGAGGEE